MKCSEVMILGELCVLSLNYSCVAVCRFCAVRYTSLLFASLCYFLITPLMFYIILRMSVFYFVFVFFYFVYSVILYRFVYLLCMVLCIFVYCFLYRFVYLLCIVLCILCIVFLFLYSCLFPIFGQIYRTLPPGTNPIAVNKYHLHHHHHIICNVSV